MKLNKLVIAAVMACVTATMAYAQSATVSVEQLPLRTLSHVVGHDVSGHTGREPVTDFLKPGSPSPVPNNLACWGTSANLITDCGTPGSMAFQSSGSVSITGGTITGITDLAVADGGTGASTASQARTNLGAAASGANSDITSIGGLTTALSVGQGGTGATTVSAARTALSAAASGANTDITSIGGLTTALSVAQGGTGSTSAATARTALGVAASGANSDITSLSGLTTALSVAQGGSGSATAAGARTNLGLTAAATMTATSGGTWTPVVTLGGATTGITYGTQQGFYTRIGSLVFYSMNITLTSKGTATGQLLITGLPFAATGTYYGFGDFVGTGNVSSWATGQAFIAPGTSTITPFAQNSSAIQGYTDANLTNTSTIRITGMYDMGSF